MNDDVVSIGLGVRTARRAARLSQRDLADLVGLSERTIRDIERGTGSPSVASVFAAANAVGLRIGVR